jgi:hypothetical protein
MRTLEEPLTNKQAVAKLNAALPNIPWKDPQQTRIRQLAYEIRYSPRAAKSRAEGSPQKARALLQKRQNWKKPTRFSTRGSRAVIYPGGDCSAK